MAYTILQIDSSPQGSQSITRRFTHEVVAELQKQHPGSRVITRDLSMDPFPHLTAETLKAFFTPPEQQNTASKEILKLSDLAVSELLEADTVVIGAPMWNFGIPSVLKAWIDHVIRAGKTFRYSATGPVGLIQEGHKAIIVSARGGVYSAGPTQSFDHQETYLKSVLSFVGYKDIFFVRAEGLKVGEAAAQEALDTAGRHVLAALKSAA